MVALAEKYTREAYTPQKRTTQNLRRSQNAYPRTFLQPKNRGPARKNRVLSQKYLDDSLEWYYYGYRYYSPELGRWPSRDPIGENGFRLLWGLQRNQYESLHQYAFVQNSPLLFADFLGLETLWVSFGFDVTGAASAANIAKIQDQMNELKAVLKKCGELDCCSNHQSVEVKTTYDYDVSDMSYPSDGDYDFDGIADRTLATDNIDNIDTTYTGPKVLATTATMHMTYAGSVTALDGAQFPQGIVLDMDASDRTLAHEVGHSAGYDGGDIDAGNMHSSDADNVMSIDCGESPDCNYCMKVVALAE